MKGLIEKIYLEVDSDTKSQLIEDFGHFPPAGLIADVSTFGKFRIAYANRVGFLFYYASRLPSIVRLVAKGQADDFDKVVEKHQEFKLIFRELDVIKKSTFLLFLLLAFFVFVGPVSVFFVCYVSASVIRTIIGMNEPGIGGFFIPASKGDPEFVLRREVYLGGGDALAGSVSHEHLHVLQYLHNLKNSKQGLVSLEKPRTQGLVMAKYQTNGLFLYLFKREEVEARLHELVLSFYRENGCLPDSIDGLVGLVALNTHEDADLMEVLGLNADHYLERFGYRPYSTRYEPMGRQLSMMFWVMANPEDKIRFVREVMSVMYANLLEYYGDVNASNRFRSLIQAPGLYERIYC